MKPDTLIPTDPIFSDIRLARIYDDFDGDRNDLIPYVQLVKDLKARRVTDFGCGTGSLALLLASEDINAVGVDPAAASIDIAESKPGADKIQWLVGGTDQLHAHSADVIVMAGNTAQAIVEPTLWNDTLSGIHSALEPDGHLIFETRNPDVPAWKDWNIETSFKSVTIDGVGTVDGWVELTEVSLPLISFRWTYVFHQDNTTLTSDSTIRFRTIPELTQDLKRYGFTVKDIREAPDRPGREHVVIAQKVEVTASR
ncbi:class I SAM-dependent methyltransferase [Candidatus Saccharibacteria bacterium]|nr:class I SAM-dependent methyltransferase [Candidatus Saccharibacteria bacterium]